MTDMRRTILWVVFTMSLVLLWDAWNKHNGHPSMFSPSRPAATSSAPPSQPAASAELPAPAATGSAGAATAGAGSIAAQPQAAVAASEKITLQSGSRLEGEMVTSRLVIEEGVSFQGSCNTNPGTAAARTNTARTSQEDAETVHQKIEKVAEQLA